MHVLTMMLVLQVAARQTGSKAREASRNALAAFLSAAELNPTPAALVAMGISQLQHAALAGHEKKSKAAKRASSSSSSSSATDLQQSSREVADAVAVAIAANGRDASALTAYGLAKERAGALRPAFQGNCPTPTLPRALYLLDT